MRFWQATPASIEAALRAASEFRMRQYDFDMNGGRIYFDQGDEGTPPELTVTRGVCGNRSHERTGHIFLPEGGRWCTWCERSVA